MANGRQARREAELTARAYAGVGRSLSKLGAAAGLGALTYKAVQFAKASVDLEAKFSQTMSLIGAATKASASEIEKLNDLAIKLGQNTAFSANEAADAMLELAKAGLDTKTIMGGGVAGTLQLAAAGGTDLGTAATIASNALNTFGLKGKDMASVAAALAGGANASSASVESLGQALQQVGPGATNAGLSIQETVAALSAFDAAGIKGSDAGTSLKTMLTRLVPQTDKAATAMENLGLDFTDADGKFVSLEEIAGRLRKGLSGLNDEQRTTALATIFGSDATRAATVLMKEGEGGIRKFIKASNDQSAAQKMAKARMSGTAGALERLSGSVETAQLVLGQELAPIVQKVADGLAENLVPAIEAGIDFAKDFGAAVAPAVKAVADVLEDLVPSADGTASVFEDKLIPTVETLADVVAGVANFIDDLPGPIKEIGVQAGIAALVLPRFTSSVTSVTTAVGLNIARLKQLRAEMTYTETRAQIVTTSLGRLGGIARNVAGVGGMVALTQGATDSSSSLQSWAASVGGGAAAGAALGSVVPGLGTAIGALGGAAVGAGLELFDLKRAQDAAAEAAGQAKPKYDDWTSTLDQTTGAITRATRAMVLQKLGSDGLITTASQLGIDTRDLIGATLGNEAAMRRVNRAAGDQTDILRGLGHQELTDFITANSRALRAQQSELRQANRDTRTWGQALRGLPPDVVTKLKQQGYEPSIKQVRALKRQYDLTPKQVRTIIRETGAKQTRGTIKGLQGEIKGLGDVDPSSAWTQLYLADIKTVQGLSRREIQKINRGLREGTGQAKPNLSPFVGSFNGQITVLRGTATSGGQGIGSNLGSGINSGISGWVSTISATAARAVRQAVAAARAEGQIKSPSRKTMYIGEMMGEGLARGIASKDGRNKKAARSLVASIVKDMDRGLDRLTSLIEKKTKTARGKAVLSSLKDEYAAIRANGRALDANERRLDKALQKQRTIVQEAKAYSRTILEGVQGYGSVVGLGLNDATGIVTTSGLLSDLANRAVQVDRYAKLIEQLRAAGLNKTTIRQLLEAGVEGGLATAEAIAAGGASAVSQINTLTSQIGATGAALGDKMSTEFYGAGIKAAAGLVRGLERKQKQLDKVAERLAESLVDKVKKALGIKSPSRVFQDIGTQTVRGLTLGLDAAPVRRAGADLSGALRAGFGAPALDAYVTARSEAQFSINAKFTADQVSALQRGREVQADLDVYRLAGGRSRA